MTVQCLSISLFRRRTFPETRPLMRLILNQIGRRLTEELPDPAGRKLLLMLDEFPALGRLDFFETALAFLAGWYSGISDHSVAEPDREGLWTNNSILDNCHIRVAFATNDETHREAFRFSAQRRSFVRRRITPAIISWLSHMMVSRRKRSGH